MKYRVICRVDSLPMQDGTVSPGKYVLATSKEFDTQALAEHYADTIDPSREPRVLLDVTHTRH